MKNCHPLVAHAGESATPASDFRGGVEERVKAAGRKEVRDLILGPMQKVSQHDTSILEGSPLTPRYVSQVHVERHGAVPQRWIPIPFGSHRLQQSDQELA